MKKLPLLIFFLLSLPVLLLPALAETKEQTQPASAKNAEHDYDDESAEIVDTPYTEQKVVFDFFYDDPVKINSALYWIRSIMVPLTETPYDYVPDFLSLKVVIHGTELVTLAKKNYPKYRDAVERMRYYASLGVEFKACNLAAQEYGYTPEDFYEFVQVVPSALTEIAHWQLQGYALITPQVLEKKFTIDEIR